ncbi:MAG: hypothetical protein P4L85_16390 [Paludisphaera borealis]|uniref:hypothetical protein n=1 Tax=Paludisphaera borealis TaxID=1387353 RepID=UPI002848A6A2|nr:hypothetical protein [Paludisphaera borealis]MDR3620932.1 hypothetical protein [Paludisphaera borealis]
MHQLVSFVAVRLAVLAATSNDSGFDGSSPAGEILRSVLDAWQEGRKVDDLSGADYVAEPKWKEGYRLERFEIGSNLKAADLDVSCPVELWMRSPAGEAVREKVHYVVSTSPRRVVVRSPS